MNTITKLMIFTVLGVSFYFLMNFVYNLGYENAVEMCAREACNVCELLK